MPIMADPVAVLKERGVSEDKIIEYQAAFHLFDIDGSGVINVANLSSLLNGTFGGYLEPTSGPPFQPLHGRTDGWLDGLVECVGSVSCLPSFADVVPQQGP